MAIDYNAIFQRWGSLVKENNNYAALASNTLVSGLQEVVSVYGSGSTTFSTINRPILGINQSYASFQNQVASFRRTLRQYVSNTLTDPDTVISQLPINSSSLTTVMPALIRDMVANSQTVKASVSTVGSASYDPGNVGSASIIANTTLDGYTAPISGVAANILYAGVASELVVPSETLTLVCTSDSSTSSSQEGGETWSVTGGQNYPLFDYHPEGSGQLGSVITANANSTIASGLGFDSFGGSGIPTGWQVVSGTPGVNILQETNFVYDVRASAVKFAGDGSTAVIQLQQRAKTSGIRARQLVLVTVQAARSGSAPGGGSLVIEFQGTGYTAAPSEKISVGLAGLPGAYGLYKFYLLAPTNIPSDLTLSITVNGTLQSGAFIYLDSMSVKPVDYRAGINLNVIRGPLPASKGDIIRLPISNNTAGKFSNFSRLCLGVQLPSTTLGSETIPDSYAS